MAAGDRKRTANEDNNRSKRKDSLGMRSNSPEQVVRRVDRKDQASSNRQDSKASGRNWGMESKDAECRMDDPLKPICRNCRTSLFRRRRRRCGVFFVVAVVALDVVFVPVAVVFGKETLIINRSLKVLRLQTNTENRCHTRQIVQFWSSRYAKQLRWLSLDFLCLV